MKSKLVRIYRKVKNEIINYSDDGGDKENNDRKLRD